MPIRYIQDAGKILFLSIFPTSWTTQEKNFSLSHGNIMVSQAALAEQIGCDERTILNIENDRGNPKFEVLCQIIAYLHIPADQIFHPDAATAGLKKQKLLLMLQECNEQEAAEILPAIEYLLALIHKRGNSNE